MIHDFYSNTKNEIGEINSEVRNYETQMEKMEKQHNVNIKVYMQKVKHLEYEHKSEQEKVGNKAQDSMKEEKNHHQKNEKEMRHDKKELTM